MLHNAFKTLLGKSATTDFMNTSQLDPQMNISYSNLIYKPTINKLDTIKYRPTITAVKQFKCGKTDIICHYIIPLH